ncbi:hypothetical protein CAT49_00080 [Acinetobacter baumannii]|uniref:Uncharacterized protein n=1 Tax=Acinetobacter baumannii 625974 TaxID=1310607 RepID=A0A009PC45_ACIBA|nr:hypothetical protein [Acinetobacter baumannii]EXC06243.1 hypothetical protein J506_2752 [Acinetobacter baumannii 625974]MDC5181674.1 hypothetical protein [Acinetobacter baumannii]OTR57654.1 hypothetical protein CAT49_00080 [Acinetobacter baumannii]
MAIAPIDYSMDVVDPFQRAMQGWQRGAQMTQQDNILKAQQIEEEQRKAALLQQQVKKEDLYKFSLIPNKTADDYSSIISRYPDLAEPYQKAWGILDAGQQQQTLNTASQVYAALRSQQPQIAKDILNEQIQAYDNSGKKSEANQLKMVLGLIDKSPDAAASSIGMLMSSVNPDKFKDILSTLGDEQRSNEKQPYELNQIAANTAKTTAETQGQVIENRYKPQQLQGSIDQTGSQIALNYATIQDMADKRQLDRDKLETETSLKLQELNPSNVKLSDGAQKLVNDTMIASVASEQAANQQLDLANRIQSAGGGYGAFSRFGEWIKGQTGNQSAMTELRNEYTRIRNSQAIKMLPPGPATDKDIEMALKGFPSETADSKTIASFLRGMAKMNQRDAAYQQMQAEWVNQVGNMGSTKRDVEILGVKVPAGTTFSGYATKNIGKALKTQSNQAVQRQISTGQRSYMSAVQ